MNTFFRAACVTAIAATCVASAHAQVSVNIAAPGLYGQIDLGGYPQPQTIYARPVVIERAQPGMPPLYLHVPPGQERNWRRNCRQYDACGRQVYFVRDDWYRNVYTPRYREVHARDDHRGPPGRDDRGGRDGDRGDQRGDHGDRGRGGDRNDGRGNGRN